MSKLVRVSKLEAAERQLAVATELYFRDSDPVAIHSLVAAAYNVIRDLSKHRKAPPMAVKDHLLTPVSAGKRQQVRDWVNSFENFFKHADRDPDAEIELNPDITEIMLMDAWGQFERLGGTLPEAGKVFKLWSGELRENAPEFLRTFAEAVKGLGKQRFYEFVTQLMLSKKGSLFT